MKIRVAEMWIDIKDWQNFFDSPLGKLSVALTQKTIKKYTPSQPMQNILGIGYAIPYLEMLPAYKTNTRCIAATPSYLGATHWPEDAPNKTVVVDETRLPFADNFFDFIIVAHCLEFSGHQHNFLRELWRVLNNQGQLMIISANKLSLWSSIGKTPLAHGGSFTVSQLVYLLQTNLYIPLGFEQTLFIPPFRWCGRHKNIARFINNIIGRLLPASGGILVANAYKQTVIPPKVEKTQNWLQWLKGKPISKTSYSANPSVETTLQSSPYSKDEDHSD